MKKKLLSLIIAFSAVITCFTAGAVHADESETYIAEEAKAATVSTAKGLGAVSETVALEGTVTKKGNNKYLLDLGRAYPLEYVTLNTGSLCTVLASNDEECSAASDLDELVNVAFGKKIRSARYNGAGYLTHVASKANDGDTGTAFISTPEQCTDEDGLTIDLDGEYKISYINVVSDNKRPRKVFVSNSEDFSDSVELSETSSGRYPLEDGNTYRYARVDFKAADSDDKKHFYIYEVEVYAYAPKKAAEVMTISLEKDGDRYVPTEKFSGLSYRYILATGPNLTKITAYTKAENVTYTNMVTTTNVSTSEFARVWTNLPLANIGDNNRETVCAINDSDPYVQVDLGSKKSVSHVEVVLRRDIMEDRGGIRILASNDADFKSYSLIGEQGNNEELAQKAVFVRTNNNPYEGFRYIRVYEGSYKDFMCLADIRVFAKDIEIEYEDALAGIVAETDSMQTVAYRMTDGDVKSRWYGGGATFDLGYCRKIEDIFITGEGGINITFYCETEEEALWYTTELNKERPVRIGCGEKARYINIESTDETVDIYDIRAYAPADKLIKAEAEIGFDGKNYTADFGKVRIIEEILPCNGEYYVSETPDFENAVKLSGHFEGAVSGRYVKAAEVAESISIMTYELPQLDAEKGVVSYDSEVYNIKPGQKILIAKYNSEGRLVSAEFCNASDGTLKTGKEAFDTSRFMVWEGGASLRPLIPEAEPELRTTEPMLELYVEKYGTDSGSGSSSEPFATIKKAQETVRELTADMQGDIIVHIGSGVFNISEPLEFTEKDGGTNGYNVIYRGEGSNKTSVSGGVPISGFTNEGNGLWRAYLPEISEAYSLVVNGSAADIAHTETPINSVGTFSYNTGYTYDGLVFNKSALPMLTNPEDAYIHTTKSWIDVFIRGTDMREENDKIYFGLYPEYLNSAFDGVKMSALPLSADYSYEIENAYELLDTKGEFYFNKKTHMLYYMPRDGESIANVYAEIPVLDDLVSIHGGGIESHIQNLIIDGIKFENASDSYRYKYGMITDQAQLIRAGIYYKKMVPGAITLDYATNVAIQNCEITNIDRGAISLGEGVIGSKVINNKIHNIGDAAYVAGRSWHNNIETHSAVSKQFDCAMRKPSWASSGDPGNISANQTNDILTTSRQYYWISSNADISRKVKPWYVLDLMKPYTISQIELYFNSYQKNFEVLVSNDPNFEEYKLVKTVGSSSVYSLTIPVKDDTKYRYIMLRKTALQQFKISGIYVRTPDEPYRKDIEEVCDGNILENNYIASTGLKHRASPAITLFYTANTKVVNNSIIDSNYTAISCGWGWEFNQNSTTNKNILIANNHIKNFNITAADGGGVYIMGNQPGTVVKSNYIEQPKLPSQENYTNVGIYGESGLRFSVFKDNVIEMADRNLAISNYAITLFHDDNQDCEIYDNYGTYTTIFDASGKGCTFNRVIKYKDDAKPDEIKRIIENSGCSFE